MNIPYVQESFLVAIQSESMLFASDLLTNEAALAYKTKETKQKSNNKRKQSSMTARACLICLPYCPKDRTVIHQLNPIIQEVRENHLTLHGLYSLGERVTLTNTLVTDNKGHKIDPLGSPGLPVTLCYVLDVFHHLSWRCCRHRKLFPGRDAVC